MPSQSYILGWRSYSHKSSPGYELDTDGISEDSGVRSRHCLGKAVHTPRSTVPLLHALHVSSIRRRRLPLVQLVLSSNTELGLFLFTNTRGAGIH